MSAAQFVESVAVFQGVQGKFYLVNGKKYHIRFPIDWARNHMSFRIEGDLEITDASGPEHCSNCDAYGSIRGVFVGYCCNCLQNYVASNQPRGGWIIFGSGVERLKDEEIWAQYPYMYNVKKLEIGDEECTEVTDDGIDIERLAEEKSAYEEEICSDQGETNRKKDGYWEGIHCQYFRDIEEEERLSEEEKRLCKNLDDEEDDEEDEEEFKVVIQ